MNTAPIKSVSLFCKEGTSDKEYHAQIVEKSGEYLVNFQYGRRGGPLTAGTKTGIPVSLPLAENIFAKLVKEKTGKGYKAADEASAGAIGSTDKVDSGIRPQLLNPITEPEAKLLLVNNEHCGQEKYDGHNRLVEKVGTIVRGINKKGQYVPLPEEIVKDALVKPFDFLIAGEIIWNKLYAFDLLGFGQKDDWRELSYEQRYKGLKHHFNDLMQIVVVPTAFTRQEKLQMWEYLKRMNKEGMVFKDIVAPFTEGRPNSGGDMLKCKFWSSLTARVRKVNLKSSIECELQHYSEEHGGDWQSCGNVTISAAEKNLKAGDYCEVRYLYALKSSGQLYQPVFLNQRDDVDDSDCLAKQLKFKGEDAD